MLQGTPVIIRHPKKFLNPHVFPTFSLRAPSVELLSSIQRVGKRSVLSGLPGAKLCACIRQSLAADGARGYTARLLST